jgi:hypothetical protein
MVRNGWDRGLDPLKVIPNYPHWSGAGFFSSPKRGKRGKNPMISMPKVRVDTTSGDLYFDLLTLQE